MSDFAGRVKNKPQGRSGSFDLRVVHKTLLTSPLILLLLIAAGASATAADSKSDAHKPYALLLGTVYDANGHPVYGVKVTIHRADRKKPHWDLYSDRQGEVAQRVPAGEADSVATAEVKVPKGEPKPSATIHIEKEERKDFSLHLK